MANDKNKLQAAAQKAESMTPASTDNTAQNAIPDTLAACRKWLADYTARMAAPPTDADLMAGKRTPPTSAELANVVISQPPKMLGDYLHKGDTAIVFAPSNTGKSLFCYQVAYAIAEGKEAYNGGLFANDCQPCNVLYYDCETSLYGQKKRCQGRESRRLFFDKSDKTDIQTMLLRLTVQCVNVAAGVLIIDNLTTFSKDANDKGANTLLLDYLNHLKELLKLTIIIVAHTPKSGHREEQKVTIDTIAGGHEISDTADNIIGLKPAPHYGEGCFYLKQLKSRTVVKADSVEVFRILDREGGGVAVDWIGSTDESTALQQIAEDVKAAQRKEVIEHFNSCGLSYREYYKKYTEFCQQRGCNSAMTVQRWVTAVTKKQ